ncbi:MAG: MFS transporter [Gaiellaceae bacterium MAG52_C11]|nr:MFS transporter [Candidatus Gaiellasilicea maunaloa]
MRRLLVLVSSIVFVDAMLFGALAPLVPGYANEFGLSKAGAGLLVGAFGAGALLGGIPGGIAAMKLGPKRAVVLGLVLLALASFGFSLASGPWALALARFVQGFSSTTTWAGALAWLTVAAPRSRRGELIGIAFGAAVFGAIIGPMFGAIADAVSIRATFGAVGAIALAFAGFAATRPAAAADPHEPASLLLALHDRRFLGGLWLNTLPALLFGLMVVLVPLTLADGGFGAFAIGLVFLGAGLAETVANPLLGRFSDRRGRLLPIRLALAASVLVAAAFAFASRPALVVALVALAAISFGGFYTPGMALVSDRAESVGLAQGLGFGIMNTAWALGNMTGPIAGGALAEAAGDALPYLLAAGLCLVTLAATFRQPGSARAPSVHPADASSRARR